MLSSLERCVASLALLRSFSVVPPSHLRHHLSNREATQQCQRSYAIELHVVVSYDGLLMYSPGGGGLHNTLRVRVCDPI